MHLDHIHPNLVHRVWPFVEDWLRDALEHCAGEYDVSQLKMLVASGAHALVVASDGGEVVGAATVEVANYPNSRVAFITAMGGSGLVNPEGFGVLADWARDSLGCTAVRGAVRESVARLCERRAGFNRIYTIVERKL